jgi:hypothetical protein
LAIGLESVYHLLVGDNDYGAEQSLVFKFINWVFELDKHVCFITHEWVETKTNRATRETSVVARKPLFTGKHRTDIPMMFDNLWRFQVVGGERARQFEAQTVGDEVIDAKTRYGGVLPPIIRDVNFEEVINRFKSYRQKEAKVSGVAR